MASEIADGAQHFLKGFSDPEVVANYAEGPRRMVPGLDALHRMTGLLLSEQAPPDARVLVLGAGGGLELLALAQAYPGWRFVGVDPAAEMLRQAERTVAAHADRIELVEGYIDDAPAGPFDAATCLLTLHFLGFEERVRTVRAIHERLRPGAPFVAAHGSFPQLAGEKSLWLDRYRDYAVASGVEADKAQTARDAVAANVHMLDPSQDEAALRAGGFADAALFYAAFTWRGWIGHA
jgi:tRNA (cmo5U34)-methyltransferase